MKDMSFLKNYLFAHRGLHDNFNNVPENSLLAFEKAMNNNYGIELDIRITKDNKIVCFHDDNLKRLTNVNDLIINYNYEVISSLNLLNSNEKIPLFSDVLKLVNGKVPLLIEIKAHKNYQNTLEKFVNMMDLYEGQFAVFSFDPKIVYWFKKNKPNYIRGQITSYFNNNNKMPKIFKYLMKTMFFNKFTKPDFISYNLNYLPNKYANKALKKGLVVISYTARNQDDFDKVLNLYDNVVFENFNPIIKK